MTERTKLLVGVGVLSGITICCFIFGRKLPHSLSFLSFIPGIFFCNKMENDDKKTVNNNLSSDPVNARRVSNDKENSTDDQNTSQAHKSNFMFGGLTGASPPKFVSFEEIVKAANGMTNMALAHEIALDKDFKLEKLEPSDGSLHKKVKETMQHIFWQLLKDELAEDPPNYNRALVLLSEIKETLVELLSPRHTRIRENIDEVLDVDLIKQQAEQGVLDFHRYARFIVSMMGKLCAPVRDDKIKELSQLTDVIETFRGILDVLQLMKLDMANFTITMIRPEIVASSVEYEKRKFSEYLKLHEDGLDLTKQWLLKHFDSDRDVTSPMEPSAGRQLTHRLLAEAYLDLLEWECNPDAETLMMDQARLLELRNKTCRLCVVGSVLLVTTNTIGAPIQGVASFKNTVKQRVSILLESVYSNKDLEAAMPNVALQLINDLKSTLKEVGAGELSPELENLVRGQILDIASPDHKIRHLVKLRIREFLQKIILSQTAKPQQVPPGLSSLQEELAGIAAQFLIIVSHNRSVFGEYYQDIVTEAITGAKTTTTANSE